MTSIRIFILFAVSALLAACGGGGDDGPSTPTAIPLASAMATIVNQNRTGTLAISGTATASGQTFNVSGSGTYSESTAPGTFQGTTGVRKHVVLTGTVTVSGSTAPLNSTSDAYYDSSNRPLGSTADGGYCVSTSATPLPASVQIGATGTWYAQDCYTSSAKLVKLGSGVATYSVEADGANSALVKVVTRVTDTAGNSIPSTTTYRVTSSGGVTRLTDVSVVTVQGVTLNLTITHQ